MTADVLLPTRPYHQLPCLPRLKLHGLLAIDHDLTVHVIEAALPYGRRLHMLHARLLTRLTRRAYRRHA
jgi:hypothetical protein